MASYALLITLAGFRYSAVDKSLVLAPRLDLERFETFFSTAGAWGTVCLAGDRLEIHVIEGSLQVDHLKVDWGGHFDLHPGITVTPAASASIQLSGS